MLVKLQLEWSNFDALTAISHPTRRAIIGQLANGPARFQDIAKPFDTALNAVTKHLKWLEIAGLIERKKQGREVFIPFRGEPLREVASWVHEYERFRNEHLDQFEQYFKEKKKRRQAMKSTKTIEIKVERTIPAPLDEVFDAWLNPKIPGTPWNAADKLLFNPAVDRFFYWLIQGTPHYGRFTEVERPGRIQHTWMSRSTLGEESMITMTFHKKEEDTLMTLVHSGLPDTDGGRGHEKGWNYFLDLFTEKFTDASRKKD
jgi:uncharacterized protein YndB with AHSA1/START domain/DNA-binding transcriptional ArsR family regulator